tara:strand:- start:393 stop:1190 length:798 start_codon:yes stop_codon:yes gene_type:complete
MKCYICGCVYKNEGFLKKSFENIRLIQSLFDETKIVICYDNSGDKSLQELSELKKEFDIDIIMNKKDRFGAWFGRAYNIGQARNQILDNIYNRDFDIRYNSGDNFYDFFIMIDMDDVGAHKINIEVLKKYISGSYIDNWDSLSFWNKGYYDTWAVSIDHLQDSSWNIPNTDGWEMNKQVLDYLKDVVDNMTSDLRPISSAFNGFAIHKMNKFKNIRYLPGTSLNNEIIIDCEHRSFYKEANKQNIKVMFSKDCIFEEMKNINKLN